MSSVYNRITERIHIGCGQIDVSTPFEKDHYSIALGDLLGEKYYLLWKKDKDYASFIVHFWIRFYDVFPQEFEKGIIPIIHGMMKL